MPLEYPREMFERLAANGTIKAPAEALEGLGALVDTLFFASLMVEESEPVRVAIVHHSEGATGLAMVRDESPESEQLSEEERDLAWDVTAIPEQMFDAQTLAKMSRGLSYGTQVLVVAGTSDAYRIDGIARRRRDTDGGSVVRFAAPRPGVIVFEQHLQQLLRYEAGQQGRRSFDVVGLHGPIRTAIAAITGEPATRASAYSGGHTFYSHAELAVHRLVQQMRTTEAGGILAISPVQPIPELLKSVRYKLNDPQRVAARIEAHRSRSVDWLSSLISTAGEDLTREKVKARDSARRAAEHAREDLDAAIEDVAELSAIDGAVLSGPKLAIYGGGCMLPSFPIDPAKVRRALDLSGERTEAYPDRHGARHRAAFCFADATPGGVAFVVSEDGPISCAHRVGEHVLVWPVQVLET